MKKLLLILFCLPLMIFAQQTVGLFSNQNTAYNGYTLINSFGSNTTYLIDNCGTIVYEWHSNYGPAAAVYLLEDGNLIRTNRLDSTTFSFGGSGGGIEILDSNSNVIWQYEVNSDSTLSHHDLEVLPNGNILILAIEFISAQEADDNGSDVTADRYSEMILEVNPTTDQIVWEWHAWDHLIQDTNPNLLNYGTISDYPGRININYAFDGTDPDWLHANSIDYNADLDQIIINSPTFNEFWILDHSTTTAEAADSVGGFSGNGGNILYRWGNPQAYNRGDSLDLVFEFQHDAHWIPSGLPDAGKIMIFNNGQERGYSSIDIIEPPLDTNNSNNYILNNNSTPYGPLNLYWSYSDSVNFYSPRVSGAQQLQNGNILICSGNQGKLFEIEHQTDSVVWEYIIATTATGPIVQGVAAVANNIFRTHRYSPSYSGFNNLTLTPTTVIELSPLPSNCQIYINGCTDSIACNYDASANVDDGSCILPDGCTDPMYLEYDVNALCDDGSCTTLIVAGCTDATACNYDPSANINDNSCIYPTFLQQSFSICNGDSIVVGSSTYNQTGTYNDTLTRINGCDSIVSTNLTIYSDLVSIISQSGNDITVTTNGGTSPYSYQWNTSETTQTIIPLYNGEYWVIITDMNSCKSDTAFFTVGWITTSIAEININNITIYPNPSKDIFNIVFNTNTKLDVDLRVHNVLGKVFFSESLKDFNGDYYRSVDLSQYPNAIYILQLNTKDGMLKKKLVVEK
ncbi:aryl-sulfate sulfotransferase [Flavobacteriales bacterium]|nr:aryl-sulfate sulfotransferase [Flavobacteriales bacterium]